MKNLKISFCIVCMNRLHHLETTIIQNIEDNIDYPELEFVLLDYNSKDKMQFWVFEHLSKYLDSGLLKYFKTDEPEFFIHSHSKNMAFRLATGDIVCNINADHFIGKNFAFYVNDIFNSNPNIVITAIDYFGTKPGYRPSSDNYGKVCVRKFDFDKIHGFDEKIINYGFEDFDFVNRLELSGLKRTLIENEDFMNFIEHGIEERFPLTELVRKINATYFHFITPTETEIIVFYNDFQYKSGIFIDASAVNSWNPEYAYRDSRVRYEITMKDLEYNHGSWEDSGHMLMLGDESFVKSQQDGVDILISSLDKRVFYRVIDTSVIQDMENFMQTYPGRAIMELNLREKNIVVNESFGKGKVYKNLSINTPLYLY